MKKKRRDPRLLLIQALLLLQVLLLCSGDVDGAVIRDLSELSLGEPPEGGSLQSVTTP
jgi:hypothetical protein